MLGRFSLHTIAKNGIYSNFFLEAAEGVVEDFGGDVLAGALFEAVEAGGGVDFGDE